MTHRWLWLFLAILPISLLGCGEDEVGPQARLYFVHQLYTQGPLEVLVDGKAITEVSPNSLDVSVSKLIDVGQHQLALRAKGASVELASTQLAFGEQSYLVGIYRPLSEGSVTTMRLYGDGGPTTIAADKAAVQVVNFLSEEPAGGERQSITVDVYVNSALLATGIGYGESTNYLTINAATGAVVQVFRTGELPTTDSPMQMVDDVTSGRFDATGGKAIVITLINTELGSGAAPLVKVAAFALR